MFVHEVTHQERNVLGSLAQRRRRDRKNLKPIVQIAPELAVCHHLGKIAVRGHYETHIHGNCPCASESFKFLLLQSPKEFWLEFQGKISNFIQE